MNQSVLTAKYRPQSFSDVIGQDIACRILSRASSEECVAPAYILSGTRGVGKTTLARIFAKVLNCERAPIAEPCNMCSACLRISKGTFIDVIELDAASHRSIDDIRDLRETVGFSPMEGRYKVFILDEAHMLTKEAYNALLKTLEEPPKYVVFIFASTDIQKFPATIISRCQHLVLRSVPEELLVQHLASVLDSENIHYTNDALELLAQRGEGSVRDSLSLLGQVLVGMDGSLTRESIQNMLGLVSDDIFIALLEAIAEKKCLEVIKIVFFLQERGIDIKYFLQELTSLWRTLFLVKQYGEETFSALSISVLHKEVVLRVLSAMSLPQIHACWQMILQGQKRIVESLDPGIALELLLINIVSFSSLIHTEELTKEAKEILVQGNSLSSEDKKKTITSHEKKTIVEQETYTKEIPNVVSLHDILSNAEELQNLIPHIRNCAFEEKCVVIYTQSDIALKRLQDSIHILEKCIAQYYQGYSIELRTVEEANKIVDEAIRSNVIVRTIEEEFSTKCEFTPKGTLSNNAPPK